MRRPGLFEVSLVVLATSWWSPRARAHSVADVLTLGSTHAPGLPGSAYLSDKVSGSWDPKDWLTLRLDFTYTHHFAVPAPADTKFQTSAGDIFLLNLGVDFMPTDRWTLSLDVSGSPRSALAEDNPIVFTTVNQKTGKETTTQYDALARDSSASIGGILSAAYDTAGESRAETAIDASVSFNWFDTQLQVLQIAGMNGNTVDAQQLDMEIQYCTAHPTLAACAPRNLRLLKIAANTLNQAQSQALGQFTFLGGVTETLYQDTDIGISGTYYLYTSDPTEALTASNTIGKGTTATGRAGGGAFVANRDYGNGIALSPLWWTVRPEITQRFGGLSIGASFQYGQYVASSDYDYDLTIGVKIAYKHKFEKWRLKAWMSGTGQRDVDSTGNATLSGMMALGAKFSF